MLFPPRKNQATISGYVAVLEEHFDVTLGTSALEGGHLLLHGTEEVAAGDLASLTGGARRGAQMARRDIREGHWNHLTK